MRLICRYSNGIVKGYVARAVGMEGSVLRLITSEVFEPGIALTAMAPFFPRTQVGRVIAVKRHPQQLGMYLLDVSLKPASGTPGPVESEGRAGASLALGQYAAKLAERLLMEGREAYQAAAFNGVHGKDREGYLAATATAVFLLLAEKNQVDANGVLATLRRKG